MHLWNAERGTRAVRTCLAKHELNMRSQEIEISDKGHSGTIEIVQQAMEDKLPPPELPGSMQLTRSDMLLYLRKNFDLGKEFVAKAPAEEQAELAHQSATRCELDLHRSDEGAVTLTLWNGHKDSPPCSCWIEI